MATATRWRVRRTARAHDEGQHRWDLAYQCLLQWTAPASQSAQTLGSREEETDGHGSRPVCAGLDHAPATGADH